MSGYKTFAVAGGGNFGDFIIDALLEKQAAGVITSVTLLTRSPGGHDEHVARGLKLSTVDYTSSSSLEAALSGIDVVLSTLSATALGAQDTLAASSKAAGVKLFVPSEYGSKANKSGSAFAGKEAVYSKLKELGLPYTAFYTGTFPDMVFEPKYAKLLGMDFASGKFSIPGSGTALISWTTRKDVSQFVVRALTEFPKDKIENRIFSIEGDRIGFNQIVENWAARAGREVSISHIPRSVFEEALKKDPLNVNYFLLLQMDAGDNTAGKPEELANGELEGWKPKKVVETIAEIYVQ